MPATCGPEAGGPCIYRLALLALLCYFMHAVCTLPRTFQLSVPLRPQKNIMNMLLCLDLVQDQGMVQDQVLDQDQEIQQKL